MQFKTIESLDCLFILICSVFFFNFFLFQGIDPEIKLEPREKWQLNHLIRQSAKQSNRIGLIVNTSKSSLHEELRIDQKKIFFSFLIVNIEIGNKDRSCRGRLAN
ncbi:hypothetical protein SSS_04126 [Sarcoptes scabiei]|nr:hypothetical protein SSS_04126 [Sarcoptes scabiei]